VLATLGLRPTGEVEEIPESPISSLALGEWFLVVANDFAFVERAPLARIAQRAELVTCAVEEHVMISAASGWKAGLRSWAVRHEAERGITHLDVSGNVPPNYTVIRDSQLKKQADARGKKAGADYVFDVPVLLAEALTGFRHDRYIGEGDLPRFQTLKPGGTAAA
jgi:hypothetical protein